MKIKITIKDPNLYFQIMQNAKEQCSLVLNEDTDEMEADPVEISKVENFILKYINMGEYITVEFDTITESVRVCPNK